MEMKWGSDAWLASLLAPMVHCLLLNKLLSYACILWLQTEEASGFADKKGSTFIPQSDNTA
jgi:hypothetical protein